MTTNANNTMNQPELKGKLKTCNRCQARENVQPMPSAGKCTPYWASEGKCATGANKPVPSAGKRATCAKGRKMSNW